MRYKRILIKFSGEALMGDSKFGQDPIALNKIANEVKTVKDTGIEICIVVGGGNICRGAQTVKLGIDRTSADYMGMLATVINAIALQSSLESLNIITRIQSSITMTSICEPYIRRRAIRHMEKGRVVIFAAGIGNPHFTTDTCAALKATEMGCDVIVKATQVDGVYSADPKKVEDAQRYKRLTYKDVITQDLQVMDIAAVTLAKDNKIPILVYNTHNKGALEKVIVHEGIFTIIN